MLTKFWNATFDGTAPIAHQLKNKYTERWVRFHALPESKRYPDSEPEYQEIFSRHNQVLSELCLANNEIYIIAPEYSNSSEPRGIEKELEGILGNPKYWQTVPMHEPEEKTEFRYYWHLHSEKTNWLPGSIDKLFRLVADEKAPNLMIVNLHSGWVFHPYDGGADIILKNNDEMQSLKNKFSGWLSKDKNGY